MASKRQSSWLAVAAMLLAACGDDEPSAGSTTDEPQPAAAASGEPTSDKAPEPAGPPKRIFAKRFVVNVRTRPDQEALRIGYLRGGAVLRATTAEPVSSEGCRGGWYELTTGGFVCNGRDVIAFTGERLPEVRATQPDVGAKLPYQYGYARKDNVPVYRTLPTDEEAAEFEGYRIPGQAVVVDGGAEAMAADGGVPRAEPSVTASDVDDDTSSAGRDAGAPEDAGPLTLDSLMASGESVLRRRMMKGFYVSIDREFRTGRRRYWRTQQNEYIPFQMLALANGSDFGGLVLDGGQWALPVGWITSRRTSSYQRREDGRLRREAGPGYHHAVRITDRETIRDVAYAVGRDGRLYRDQDLRQVVLAPRPDDVGPEEKWIDVDLERQTLVAYEGDRPVFATLISSGRIRREGVPDLDHRTPPGDYRISAKHLATTMDGDNAFDGPYSIEDVPYVMYYDQGYALHMAFWHDAFGRPKSHGCINLSPSDARWLFQWTDPSLPSGWHGTYPTEDYPGTLIRIHGETPRG